MRRSTLLLAALLTACGGEPHSPSNDGDLEPNNTMNNVAPNNAASNNAVPNNASNNVAPNNTSSNNHVSGDCVPSRDAYVANALPHIDNYCGRCHGETPEFGAPVTLLDYDLLIAGAVGDRLVDTMAAKLVDGSMPPPGSPRPLHSALDTMVEWASCGEQHADHTLGLEASAPLWSAPEEPPPGLETFDVVASDFAVSPTTLDLYQCFVIEAPIDEPRLIRRIEPVIDESRVLHHSLVKLDASRDDAGATFSCHGFPPGEDYVYVWGPGQPSIEFPDGGIRIEPGHHFVLQIHYNNGAGIEDVRDSSGFRVFHEPVGGTEYGLYEIGSIVFPPIRSGEQYEATFGCTVRDDAQVIATWPHMHEIGSEFNQTVERADGADQTIIELSGWSFEAQLIYDTPVSLKRNDVLRTTCAWDNYKDFTVVPGLGTADEMCFGFMYVTPPHARFCD